MMRNVILSKKVIAGAISLVIMTGTIWGTCVPVQAAHAGAGKEYVEPDDPTEASTEAVTEAPTEAETEAPTEAVTEAPTETVTEAPTEAPTPAHEMPTKTKEVPTEAPIKATTEVPTQATTQASTQVQKETMQTQEAPTQVPTQASTQSQKETMQTQEVPTQAQEAPTQEQKVLTQTQEAPTQTREESAQKTESATSVSTPQSETMTEPAETQPAETHAVVDRVYVVDAPGGQKAEVVGHYGSEEEVMKMYELVNALRIENGKEILTYNPKMAISRLGAQNRAVTSANYWEHWCYQFTENIAYTPVYYSDYDDMEMVYKVFEAWANSPAHRYSMLNAGSIHHETAISVFYKQVEGGYERYWVQCFR